MSAHSISATPKGFVNLPGIKILTGVVTLSASYDAGGSTLDCSTAGGLGSALGFTKVHGIAFLGHETAGSSKYECVFVPAASDAPATPKIKVHDTSAAADAEASGDLSATLIRVAVFGF